MLPTEVWTPRRSTVRFHGITVDSPTPGSSDSDTTSAIGFQRLNAASGLNPSMAIVIVTLMASFFFLAFISIYMKRCASSQAEGEAGAGASPSRQHDPPLRGGGLEKTFIDSFPLLSYSAMKGLRQGCDPSECCVCLTEFVEDESLRMLPKCGHSFHPDCIDMWLYSHSSCPLCRQSLVLLPQEILSFAIFTQEACGRATEGSNAAATDAQGEVRINIDEILAENEASGAERDSSTAAGRVGERETALILSRNSEISRKAAQDLERMQNSSLSYASVGKNSPSASDCLRRSLSVGESGRSLRKAVGLKRDAYSPQKAAEADGTLFGSRLQHAESCSMLVELISRHQEAEGDKNLRGRE